VQRDNGKPKVQLEENLTVLSFEDLHHEPRSNLIHVRQCRFQNRPVFIRSFAEDAFESKRSAPHEQFCGFQLFAVIGYMPI
jgi:hypothetical protein